jgi:hypothetical protein
MNKVYDNGYYLLGKVEDIINFTNELKTTSDLEETIYEIKKELQDYYSLDSIVCIYYDNPMGYTIEEFATDSVIWESEEK